jgi:uncharacterized protein YdaU (DUF1376 family)
MRKFYPMPVAEVFLHPAYRALSAAGRGMVWSLLEHYWLSECRELPKNQTELFTLARSHRMVWSMHRDEIIGIINDVEPILQDYFVARVGKTNHLRRLSEHGIAMQRKRAREKKLLAAGVAELAPQKDRNQVERPPTPDVRGARARIIQK